MWKQKNRTVWIRTILLLFVMISSTMLSPLKIYAEESEQSQDQITFYIPVKIKNTGNNRQNEIFSFLLKQKDVNTQAPAISKISTTGTSEKAFQIQYTKPGVYKYSLSQVPGNNKNWNYDKSEYSLEVYVTRNDQTDKLQALLIAYNTNGEKVDPVFENGFKAPEIKQKSMSVKTGDSADIEAIIALLVICGSILVGTYRYKKKLTGK